MAERSAIEWTEATWNPVTGCSKVSPGCAHCYAETISLRFGHSKKPWVPSNATENVCLHPERLDQPLRWRRPRAVFVNSMSDLFHDLVPDEFIAEVFRRMALASRHTFQILTKRPERMRDVVNRLYETDVELSPGPLANVWLGTSIENSKFAWRAEPLRETSAAVRFVSAEPLLGPVAGAINLTNIDWVIVGGESGHKHRAMQAGWVRELRDQCLSANVAYFFKQWGGRTPKAGGRELDGRTWDQMPELANQPAIRVG